MAGVIRYEGEQTYQALTPTALTAYKGLSFLPSDVLSQSSGSAIGGSLTVSECIDSNQGSLCFWYYPYNYGNAGQTRYLYDCYVDANNRYRVSITSDNVVSVILRGNGTIRDTWINFTAIKPFTWNHIVATWSKNTTVNGANYLAIYLNGVLGVASTSVPVAMTSIPSTFSIGSDYTGKNSANGLLAYKIMRQYMTADQVTSDYNSGNGSTEFFTRTPHTIALGLTSDSNTGISFVHRGASVTAIADGATEDTVTTVANSDNRFSDNDRVILSAGNGYSSNIIGNTFVDGAPSSTSVNVDDGAGADVGLIEKVGVFATLNGSSQYFTKTSPANIDLTDDYTVCGWVKTISSGNIDIYYKDGSGGIGLQFRIAAGKLDAIIYQNTSTGIYCRSTPTLLVNDGKWHFIAFTYDDSPTPTLSVYCDGYLIGSSTTTTGTKDTGAGIIDIGYGLTAYLNGSIQDVMVWTSLLTPANILTLAINPHSESGLSPASWWVFDDAAGATTISDQATAGNNNHLTLVGGVTTNYGTHSRTQSAFITRNIFVDGDMRQAIGAYPRISGATVTKNTTTPIADEQDLKIVNTGAAQGYAGQSIKTASGEDYYFFGLVKGLATVDGASVLVNVDADASKSITATQAGLTAATVTETEFCFQAADTDTTVDLGTGSVTSAEIAYWDNIKVLSSLAVNGSCEGGSDPPTSWTQEANATVISDTSPHAGTNCLKVTAGADNVGAYQNVTLVSGKLYTIIAYCKATAGDTARVIVDKGDTTLLTVGSVTATAWTRVRISFTATGTSGKVYLRGVTNTDVVWFDDIAIIRDDSASASTATKGGIVPQNQPLLIR